ncbi:hypothetical protein BGX31_004900 [Mortierella sp. GBA43]|nr:hypothetical protein BGX31_004900 [Mortierella sp. GBA43]
MEIDAPPEEPEKIEGDKDDEDLEAGSVSTKVVALPKEPIDLRFKNLPVGIKARQVPSSPPVLLVLFKYSNPFGRMRRVIRQGLCSLSLEATAL